MVNRLKILAILFLFSGFVSEAQVTVLDGAYVKEHNPTKRVIPYPSLREADVMWVHRVWQEIDVRQKINHPYYYPVEPIQGRKSLFDVIREALLEGALVAYNPGPTLDDEFQFPMTPEEVEESLNPVKQVKIQSLDDDDYELQNVPDPIVSKSVVKYRIKEDWLFDKQRSERYVRIIGIAPVIEYTSEEGEVLGDKIPFWLYFPECRYVFNMHDAFNMQNEAQHRTFEDLFQKRMFSSYIIKEANVFDRRIQDYYRGLDALLEAENIKNKMFLLEHDLWHY
jgi:gliding motility associated protien GldN